jgi:antirestriction protein ArdC
MSRRSRRSLTDEERAERREAERELARQAAEALLCSQGWQNWLRVRAQTGLRRYSLTNQLLIALQLPEATRVAGFQAWLRLGYCVRKGERGLRIFAPCPPNKAALEKWRKQGADPHDRPRTYFKLTAVFDRSQIAPLDPPAEPVPLDPPIADVTGDELAPLLDPLVEFAASIGSQLTFEPVRGGAHGFYALESKRIVVDDGLSPNGQVKTALHELAHALVRHEAEADGALELSYAEEELVVECVAYVVCSTLGLDASGYSIAYLASWGEQEGALATRAPR